MTGSATRAGSGRESAELRSATSAFRNTFRNENRTDDRTGDEQLQAWLYFGDSAERKRYAGLNP